MDAIRKNRLEEWDMENPNIRILHEGKARNQLNKIRDDRQYKHFLYYGMTAYVIAAALVGWFLGVM